MVVVRKRGQICGGVYANAQVPNPKAFSGGVVPVFNPILFPNGPPRVPMPMPSRPKDLISIRGSGRYYDEKTKVFSTGKVAFAKYLRKKNPELSESEANDMAAQMTISKEKEAEIKEAKLTISPTTYFQQASQSSEEEFVPPPTLEIPKKAEKKKSLDKRRFPKRAKQLIKQYAQDPKEVDKNLAKQEKKFLKQFKEIIPPVKTEEAKQAEEASQKMQKAAERAIRKIKKTPAAEVDQMEEFWKKEKELENRRKAALKRGERKIKMKAVVKAVIAKQKAKPTVKQVKKLAKEQEKEMLAPIMHMADKEERKKITGTTKDMEDMISALASQTTTTKGVTRMRNLAPSRKERAVTTKRAASQRSKSKKGTEGIAEKLASKEKTMIRKKPALAKIPKEKIMKKRVVKKPKSVAQKKPKLAKICSEKIKVLV